MKKALIAVIVVVVILLIIVGKGIGTYNNIIALEEGVKAQWAQVENTYQRRFDLIPNLVSTVQGEANFEKSTLTEVMDMRSRMGGTVKLDESLMNDEAALKRFQEMQGSLGTRRRRKPHRCGTQALQRNRAGIQHHHSPVPDKHRRRFRRRFPESTLLR